MVFFVERFKVAAVERVAYLLHKLVVEIEIVQDRKAHPERFLRLDQVADVRPRIVPASGTRAALVERTRVFQIFFIHYIYFTVPRKDVSVAGVAGRHNAVEEIDAADVPFTWTAR